MKAAVLTGVKRLEIQDIPMPKLGDNDILVHNKVVAVCNATDSKFYKGLHALVQYPSVIGHEGAGVVTAVGKNVTKIKVGDKVLGAGYPNSPEMASLWGQYCEYGAIPETEAVKIPENVGFEEACMSHMLGETLNAVYLSRPVVGDNVLIIGAGAVGISLLALLKCTFADKVIVADILDDKLAFAKSVGADAVLRSDDPDFQDKILELTGGRGVNKIFEAVGRQETYNLAFDTIAYNGLILAFGMMEGEMIVPFRKMINSECSVQWCRNTGKGANQNKARILDMIARGSLDVKPFITSRFAFEDINDAFAKIAEGREIRTLIEIDN